MMALLKNHDEYVKFQSPRTEALEASLLKVVHVIHCIIKQQSILEVGSIEVFLNNMVSFAFCYSSIWRNACGIGVHCNILSITIKYVGNCSFFILIEYKYYIETVSSPTIVGTNDMS